MKIVDMVLGKIKATQQGVMSTDFTELSAEQLSKAIIRLRRQGLVHSYRQGLFQRHFATQEDRDASKLEYEAGAKERYRERVERYEQTRSIKSKAQRAKARAERSAEEVEAIRALKAKRLSEALTGKTRKKVSTGYAPEKPAVPATVTIKASGRGPAYLPGPPIETERTIYTYGRSPTNPTHTTTHME